jgi:hypothetical protein
MYRVKNIIPIDEVGIKEYIPIQQVGNNIYKSYRLDDGKEERR